MRLKMTAAIAVGHMPTLTLITIDHTTLSVYTTSGIVG